MSDEKVRARQQCQPGGSECTTRIGTLSHEDELIIHMKREEAAQAADITIMRSSTRRPAFLGVLRRCTCEVEPTLDSPLLCMRPGSCRTGIAAACGRRLVISVKIRAMQTYGMLPFGSHLIVTLFYHGAVPVQAEGFCDNVCARYRAHLISLQALQAGTLYRLEADPSHRATPPTPPPLRNRTGEGRPDEVLLRHQDLLRILAAQHRQVAFAFG
nr:hypothetical protein CFP56_07545 [Quercus suber]